jgi:hypothetical protein
MKYLLFPFLHSFRRPLIPFPFTFGLCIISLSLSLSLYLLFAYRRLFLLILVLFHSLNAFTVSFFNCSHSLSHHSFVFLIPFTPLTITLGTSFFFPKLTNVLMVAWLSSGEIFYQIISLVEDTSYAKNPKYFRLKVQNSVQGHLRRYIFNYLSI